MSLFFMPMPQELHAQVRSRKRGGRQPPPEDKKEILTNEIYIFFVTRHHYSANICKLMR